MIRPRVGAWFSRGRAHPYIAASLYPRRPRRPTASTIRRILIVALVGAVVAVAALALGPLAALLLPLAAGAILGGWYAIRDHR
jgi:hypothetical protein